MPTGHLLLLVAINLVWAFSIIVGKTGVGHFPPLFFTALRFLLVVALLLPWLRPVPGRMRAVAGIALTMGVLHFSAMFSGLALSGDVTSVAIASQLHIPIASLLALALLGERIGWRQGTALALGCIGVGVVGFDPLVARHLDALLLIVAAAVFQALTNVLVRRHTGIHPLTLNAWIAAIGAPPLLALSFLLEEGQGQAVATADLLLWGCLLWFVFGNTLIAHGGLYFLLARHPVALMMILLLPAQVLSVLFGVLIWGDRATWQLAIGGALTFAGVALLTVRRTPKAPAPPT